MPARKRREDMPIITQDNWLETPTILDDFFSLAGEKQESKNLLLQPNPQLSLTDVTRTEAKKADRKSSQNWNPGYLKAIGMAEESRRMSADGKGV